MKPFTDGLTNQQFPTLAHAIILGGLLGAAMATLGSILLVIVLHLYVSLTVPNLPGPFSQITIDLLVIYALLGLVFTFFAILPGIMGGILIALILHARARRGLLSKQSSLIVGLVVGAASGAILALFLVLLIRPEGHQMITGGPIQTVIFTLGIAIVAGCGHAALTSRWLGNQLS